MSLHLELAARIEETFSEQLEAAVEVKLDALIIRLDNGSILEARMAAPDAYAISWIWGEVELRIDTAPLHPHLATFPNHLHGADGHLYDDPLTTCNAAPWDNLRAVLDAVLSDPLLKHTLPTTGVTP